MLWYNYLVFLLTNRHDESREILFGFARNYQDNSLNIIEILLIPPPKSRKGMSRIIIDRKVLTANSLLKLR